MGKGCARWGALLSIDALSWRASFTILYCSISNCIIAFCKYLTPPWINFVLRDEVPDAKSSASIKAVFKPINSQIITYWIDKNIFNQLFNIWKYFTSSARIESTSCTCCTSSNYKNVVLLSSLESFHLVFSWRKRSFFYWFREFLCINLKTK